MGVAKSQVDREVFRDLVGAYMPTPPGMVIGLEGRRLDASAFADPDEDLRAAALGTVLARPDEATALREPIAARLADLQETEDNRILAAHALKNVKPLPVADLIPGLARKQGAKVRTAAASSLIAEKGVAGEAAGPLARCLLAGDKAVRFQSVMALRGIGGAAVAPIVQVVEESEKFDITRQSGLDALGFIGGEAEGALPLAERLSKDSPPAVMVSARFAVASIACGGVKGEGARREKELAKAVRPLMEMVEHEDSAVRLLAMERLGWLKEGAPGAGGALLGLLKEGTAAEREAAALGLARTRTPSEQAVEPLIAALRDSDPAVRKAAAIALSAYGMDAKPALEPLVARVKDKGEVEDVRRAAGASAKAIVKAEKGPYWA